MAATLFLSPFVRATNANGAVLSGAKLYFYQSGTLVLTPTYTASDQETEHTNPVIADAGGLFPDIYLNPAVTYRAVLKTSADVAVPGGDVDPYSGSATGGGGGTIGLFNDADTEAIPAPTDRVHTSGYREAGKGGAWYVYDEDVDAAYVTDHPGWSFLSADGRGFRLAEDQHITFEMFGAYGDWIAFVGGTDDYPQWLVAKDYLDTLKFAYVNSYFKSVPALHFARTAYYMNPPGDIVFDLTDGIYQLIGSGPNTPAFGWNTLFIMSGKTGLVVQGWDTTGVTGTTTNTPKGGTGSLIQDIGFLSQGGTIGNEIHGFVMRGQATFIRCYAENFPGHGFKISADIGGNGNANLWRMYDCNAQHCGRAGLFVDGGDANAGLNIGFNGAFNGTYGIYDSSFLGNRHIGFHLDGNGLTGVAGPDYAASRPGGQVHRTGHLYNVVKGQEAGASTNPPTGSATSNTWWDWNAAGAASALYPNWVSGTTFLHGGAIYCDDPNAKAFFDGHVEGNQHGGGINGRSLAISSFSGPAGPNIHGNEGYVAVNALSATQMLGGGLLETFFGGVDNTSGTIFQVSHTTLLADVLGLRFDGVDFSMLYGATLIYDITGPLTAQQFGTGAAAPSLFHTPKIVIGTRIHTNGTAAPATGAHARGEIVWNEAPSAGGTPGWICTTAGTPGTWKALANVAA